MARNRRRKSRSHDPLGREREITIACLCEALIHRAPNPIDTVLCGRVARAWFDSHEDVVREAWDAERLRAPTYPQYDVFIDSMVSDLVAYARDSHPAVEWRDHETQLYPAVPPC